MGSTEYSDDELSLMLQDVEHQLGSPLRTEPQAPLPVPLVIIISGSSGVGKDAVIKRLAEIRKDVHFSVTMTTREKRPGEVHGKDYIFVSKEEFESMIRNDEFLEHALVYGDYKGIHKDQIRESLRRSMNVVLRLDIQGAATMRKILGTDAVFIYLVAESEASLVKRLIRRGTETKEKLLQRIIAAREELTHLKDFDYVIVNADGKLDESVSLISSIIDAEKARVHPRVARL